MARKNNARFLREKEWGNTVFRMYLGKKQLVSEWHKKLQTNEKVGSFLTKSYQFQKKTKMVPILKNGRISFNCYAYGSTLLPLMFPKISRK